MVDVPQKPRRHRWVTEALNQGDAQLSVWPSPDELRPGKKQDRFLETIIKIGNDPRVRDIKKSPHPEYNVIYVFYLDA